MEKTRIKTKATKKKAMKDLIIELNPETRTRLDKIAKLSATSLSQVISVMLAAAVVDAKRAAENKLIDNFIAEEWTKDKKGSIIKKKVPFGLGEK